MASVVELLVSEARVPKDHQHDFYEVRAVEGELLASRRLFHLLVAD